MPHLARLRKVGGSVMLVIPKAMLDALDLASDASVGLSIKAGRLIVDPKKRRRYSLDELCKRFAIDLSARTKHGALLDCQLTAQVYLELIGGRQKGFSLAPAEIAAAAPSGPVAARQRPVKLASLLTAAEKARHDAFVAQELGDKPVWLKSA